MNLTLFLNGVAINSMLTAAIVVGIVCLLIVERIILKKLEDIIKKWIVILVFLFSFALLIAGTFAILLIWGVEIMQYLQDSWYSIVTTLMNSVGKLVSSAIIIFISLLILKFSKMAFRTVGTKPGPMQRRKRTIAKVSTSIIKYLVGVITILIVLSVWGINVAPALAGLGIMGLVIGLGAQKFIHDLISGFFIVFEHHFDVGDVIEVQGFKGEVTSIGLKTTKLRNWKGDVKILSNGEISNLLNYSINPSTAVVEFGIAYQENMQQTIDLLNEELPKLRKDLPDIIEDPKVVGVINLNSSSVDMRVVAKTLNEKHYAVERELRKQIKIILDNNNIEIPFPQVVVNQPTVRPKTTKKKSQEIDSQSIEDGNVESQFPEKVNT
ncbi:mechanosensitive ion channel family protein [Peloplasma aerotolerans]|uniref:Mechanosensitive ion channel family protein n=1 Tax=Peloplasma aerotolerans TaxID=3044389 RepID=A0AAW6U8U6_9MOLU|nr:mechanosensitive ion channel family protein [Mariniplasma sp. M4Ah]MDI6453140.1 mechanosensitive ion channel family protein [Mariniplasma sp. M4Ah]